MNDPNRDKIQSDIKSQSVLSPSLDRAAIVRLIFKAEVKLARARAAAAGAEIELKELSQRLRSRAV